MSLLKIATRKSKLAQIQADLVIESLRSRYGQVCEKVLVSTTGDQLLHITLDKIGGKGLFVKEIETALFEGRADAAVHSMKDVPHQLPEGCELAAILFREDVRDAFIARHGVRFAELPAGARIGTSSRRRAQQLQQLRPDIHILPIRGNVQTRLRKLETEQLDGTVLAVAGLKRLGLESAITEYFEPEQIIPAAGQGALGLEILSRHEQAALLRQLDEPETRICVGAERSFMRTLNADCHAAVGAYARLQGNTLHIIGMFEIGGKLVKKEMTGEAEDYLSLGKQLANAILDESNATTKNMVYLIGAGPGDEELLTLKAKRALENCSAVVYDRLANPAILRYAPENCELHYCGKAPGRHSKTQNQINDLLVSLVKAGHTVGRLKGGDPYVFGRGGEEALRLQEENIAFEVIPGVPSPIAVLNYAGIPISHRGIAQSFHVFTGTSAEHLRINWQAAAGLRGTLVFLMGIRNLRFITEKLVQHGKASHTPCAVIMRGTTSKQKTVRGTLDTICQRVERAGLSSPGIIVVGDVVTLSETLNWYERKPLFGRNICITRAKEQARELRERLWDLGAEVTEIHTIRIVKADEILREYLGKLAAYDYMIFTSVNGVTTFFDFLKNNGFDIRQIQAAFAAIGPATADALKDRGVVPVIVAERFVAESLFDAMKPVIQPGDHIFAARSRQARPYLVEQLRAHGCLVDEVPVYHVEQGQLQGKSLEEVDSIIFTSPTTVRNLIEMTSVEEVRTKDLFAIGPITNQELLKYGLKAQVCETYSVDGIIQKLECRPAFAANAGSHS